MNNKEFYFKKLVEIVNSNYIKNEDYEAIVNEIAGHYEKALTGNLLFVSFSTNSTSFDETLTSDKVIINIPIRTGNLQRAFELKTKWLSILKETFDLELTKLPIIKAVNISHIQKGLFCEELYAVTFHFNRWRDLFYDHFDDITDKITRDFVYNSHAAKVVKSKLTDKMRTKETLASEEMTDLISALSENLKEIATRGLSFNYSFTHKKACIEIKNGIGPVILSIPGSRFDAYLNAVTETLHFQTSYEKESVFYPCNTLMAEVINNK